MSVPKYFHITGRRRGIEQRMVSMTRSITAVVPLVVLLLLTGASHSATLSEARSAAIGWLESHQNADGSWGSGERRPLVTAEAVLAMAKAGRAQGAPARRARAWLLNQRQVSLDYRARAVRALQASGVDVSKEAAALNAIGDTGAGCPSSGVGWGWGPTSERGITSYDSALVLAAIKISGLTPVCETVKRDEILARKRSDHGWSGDQLPVEPSVSPSDRTLSGEILRALSVLAPPPLPWNDSPSRWFLSTDIANGGAAVDSQSETLEIAARLAAIHAVGQTDSGLETELLSRSSASNAWSATDAFVNAIGLLAVTTKPGASFSSACSNNWDCDTALDADDAFPHDSSEQFDSDGDGIGDFADPDRDGDGFCDPGESGASCSGAEGVAFAGDPTEHADSDGDGIGDNDEVDADGDGLSAVEEIERGTDPTLSDTDGDGQNDSETCPLIASGIDDDHDGVCSPVDECDGQPDPLDLRDLDDDEVCDGADPDDDGDTFPDHLELAAGSDPRDGTSLPENIAVTKPGGDFDSDGLANGQEPSLATSPYLADTDADGAADAYEIGIVPPTAPNDASSQPPALVAVFSSASTQAPASPGEPFEPELSAGNLRATVTGGQATPVAQPGAPQSPSSAAGFVSLAGFQPQTVLGRDLDGDGLTGSQEAAARTSGTNVDSDGDLFVDGQGGVVAVSRLPGGWDLEPDSKVDGEADFGTDPADGDEHPGMPGDVAPLGHPNGRIDVADAMVEVRITRDSTITAPLAPQNEAIALQAADANEDEAIDAADALEVLQAIRAEEP